MTANLVRRIRDNIHGTINLTDLEDRVLAHPYVQRMRRIKQLSFLQYVFPGASHSRFEHSLGVMHLAGVAWRHLIENQTRLEKNSEKYADFAKLERQPGAIGFLAPTFPALRTVFAEDYPLQVLRLSALLHDLGHPPFSHSGELFLPTWTQVLEHFTGPNAPAGKKIPDYLAEYLAEKIAKMRASGRDPSKVPVRHEIFTLILGIEILTGVGRDRKWAGAVVDPRDFAAVVTGEIEPATNSPLQLGKLYKLLNELVSGELDVDRMDYLLRDSRECGVVYGIFDESRLLNALNVYQDAKDGSLHLAVHVSGLAAFEDYLRARHSMYLQLYFHKTSVGAEAMLQHLHHILEDWHLPIDPDVYARIDEYNIAAVLSSAAREKKLSVADNQQFHCTLEDLLFNRRLWKRVYESTTRQTGQQEVPELQRAQDYIRKHGFAAEQISSSTSLTRFRPRSHPEEPSRVKLRLIKKDDRQFPRVVPVEDHLTVTGGGDTTVNFSRIYVEDKDVADGAHSLKALREGLARLLLQS